MPDKMYDYYDKQDVLPTHGGFQSNSDLNAYEYERRKIFIEKLFLPPRMFKDSKMIEFGPDSGENTLVFALWGAYCELVEPNEKAHAFIKDYFKKFDLSNKLGGISKEDILEYSKRKTFSEKFDFIDAEGFIYTVRPESLWIDLFSKLLNDDGFIILFYGDIFGSFFELLLKVVYTRYRSLTGDEGLEAAQKLFKAKWDSIPHKRSLQSWVMDVMENPFVRLKHFFELQALCKQMHDSGLYLYSSWPTYKDGLDVHWFKKTLSADEHLVKQNEFISKSCISHMFGRKHFIVKDDKSIERRLRELITIIDGLIDDFSTDAANIAIACLSELFEIVNSDNVISSDEGLAVTTDAIKSVKSLLLLLDKGDAQELISFCNSNQSFIKTWGMPSQFAVFRKSINMKD